MSKFLLIDYQKNTVIIDDIGLKESGIINYIVNNIPIDEINKHRTFAELDKTVHNYIKEENK